MNCLCERNADNIVVKLWWQEPDSISVTVNDVSKGERFAITDIKPEKALDAFYHPFAYYEGKEAANRASWDIPDNSGSD